MSFGASWHAPTPTLLAFFPQSGTFFHGLGHTFFQLSAQMSLVWLDASPRLSKPTLFCKAHGVLAQRLSVTRRVYVRWPISPDCGQRRTWTVCFLHALGPVEMVNKCWLDEPVHLQVQDPALRSLWHSSS